MAYVAGGAINAVTSIRAVAKFSQFTFFSVAQTQLLLGGAFTFMILGGIYFLVPRLAGKPWPSAALIRIHFAAVLAGLVLQVGGLFAAGWIQGGDLNHPAVSFPAIAGHVRLWLVAATAGQALTLLGSLALTLNFARLMVVCFKQPAKELLCGSAAMEVPVS